MGYTKYVFMALIVSCKKLQSCKYIENLHTLHHNSQWPRRRPSDKWEALIVPTTKGSDMSNVEDLTPLMQLIFKNMNLLTVIEVQLQTGVVAAVAGYLY